jgi:hypothetical protein
MRAPNWSGRKVTLPTRKKTVPFADLLAGGDRRSTGRADEVAAAVLAHPARLAEAVACIQAADPVVCMRAADAVEKATRIRPALLIPFKADLLRIAGHTRQQEVQWHAAQILSRLPLTDAERRRVVYLLDAYLAAESRIVRTFAMQALADLAFQDASLRAGVIRRIKKATASGSPAMKSRGRHLLAKLARAAKADEIQARVPGGKPAERESRK